MLIGVGRLNSVRAVVGAPLGPLDIAYGLGMVGYSLSALSRSYAKAGGALVDVRRSTDNATTTLHSLPNGMLPVAALLSWAGSASVYATKLYDHTGGGYHASNANASSQAILVNAGALVTSGGMPALQTSSSGGTYSSGSVGGALNNYLSYSVLNLTSVASGNRISDLSVGQSDYNAGIIDGIVDGGGSPSWYTYDSRTSIASCPGVMNQTSMAYSCRLGSTVTVGFNGNTSGNGSIGGALTGFYVSVLGSNTAASNWGKWSQYVLFSGNSTNIAPSIRAYTQKVFGTP